MKIEKKNLLDEAYEELYNLVHSKLTKYYDIDKVKTYAVYVWTKGDQGDNVFDIAENEIVMYDKNHVIKEEIKPIIGEVQNVMKEIREIDNGWEGDD